MTIKLNGTMAFVFVMFTIPLYCISIGIIGIMGAVIYYNMYPIIIQAHSLTMETIISMHIKAYLIDFAPVWYLGLLPWGIIIGSLCE